MRPIPIHPSVTARCALARSTGAVPSSSSSVRAFRPWMIAMIAIGSPTKKMPRQTPTTPLVNAVFVRLATDSGTCSP